MKILFVIVVLGVLGFFGLRHQPEPTDVANPVFVEIRVTLDAYGRQIEAAVFGKTLDEADCQQRARIIKNNLAANCEYCVSKSVECKTALAPRNAKFFDDTPSSVTYLSLNHSRSTERDVRVIFWGLTGAEGDAVCDQMKLTFEKIHSGPMKCVRAISS
ncbi:hypothetical protein SKTS_10300 [Sulfurimicrobium lacus]|uniref:Uncharacterized protein n=1 Tax=Sulfurimicrobium lacus TaxID=2715678 RepID=A0A6F8V911_9PROT|nr:hypothetical protein [Sulfurimicrobium lacus]BCB26144.1 hypothetical protein SKTS_10300 [Sulfurimicrobium lacus]